MKPARVHLDPIAAMWRFVHAEPNSGCWLWAGQLSDDGYARFDIHGPNGKKRLRVHRAFYEAYRSPIGASLVVDHLCRTRCCVNPQHLEIVTHAENVRRAGVAAKATIPKPCARCGGERIRLPSGNINCRPCNAARWHEWKAKNMKSDRASTPPAVLRSKSVSPPTPVPNGGTLPPLVSVHLNALLKKVKPQ